MLRVFLALMILLIAVPVAGAKSFEMATASGDFSYRGIARFDSLVVIESISAGARVTGPAELKESIQCIGGKALQTCIKIVKGNAPVELRVLKPIALSLHQRGAFALAVRTATLLANVWISGCGRIGMHGDGRYRADGGAYVTYLATDSPSSLRLK